MPYLPTTPDPVLRSDRMHLDPVARGRMMRLPALRPGTYDPLSGTAWCIYGDPSSPAYWDDSLRVLWSNCGHPTDLTDGASSRHKATYAGRFA